MKPARFITYMIVESDATALTDREVILKLHRQGHLNTEITRMTGIDYWKVCTVLDRYYTKQKAA